MEKRMNRFWKIAIGSCLVGTSLVAAGGGINTASAAPVEESMNTGDSDDEIRGEFIRTFLAKARQENPDDNIVIIHSRHTANGVYRHQHEECPISLGRTIGYEAYFSRRGSPFTLTNEGDGGWINWGYDGWFNRSGMTITAQ